MTKVWKVVWQKENKLVSARIGYKLLIKTYKEDNEFFTVDECLAFETLQNAKDFISETGVEYDQIWEAECETAEKITQITNFLGKRPENCNSYQKIMKWAENTEFCDILKAPEGSLLCTNLKLTQLIY